MLAETEVLALILFSSLLAAYAQFVFKRSIRKFDFSIRNVIALLRKQAIIIGLAMYFVSLIIYLYALSSAELSFVYPVLSATFIFVMLIARFKLNEPITTVRALGILLIVIGIAFVAAS
jgi:drug/metabolite transporter (DMT)-like permease